MCRTPSNARVRAGCKDLYAHSPVHIPQPSMGFGPVRPVSMGLYPPGVKVTVGLRRCRLEDQAARLRELRPARCCPQGCLAARDLRPGPKGLHTLPKEGKRHSRGTGWATEVRPGTPATLSPAPRSKLRATRSGRGARVRLLAAGRPCRPRSGAPRPCHASTGWPRGERTLLRKPGPRHAGGRR